MNNLESLATEIGKDIKDIKTRYATKEEMHEAADIDYSQIVTHEELEEKHYLTEHQNISHLATKEEVSKKLDDNVFKKVEQLLKDENKIDGSVWLWDKNMGSFNSNGWFKYRPISVDKGDKFYLLNIRGVFSYVVSKDGTRLLTKFSQSDSLVTTDYVASEDAILYITSQPNENAKVFNASLKELRNANVDFSNLPSDYISLKIPKLSLDIQPEELSFVEVVKQILDEKTFKAGKAWSGNGNGTYDADTWGTYPAVNLKAGITYGLKNIRGVFTHYFDKSGTKIFSFSSKDEIITRDFIPNVDGYILITRLITDKPSKIFQGGLGSARNLDNLEYGTSAIASKVPFIIPDNSTTQFGLDITGIDTTQQTTINNLSYMSPIKKWEKSRGFIDTINVYVKQAGIYNFAIGNIDQNDLIVSPRIFQKQLSTGYNTLDVINEEHEIFYGEQLFFEAHDNTVYAARGERNLIQDAQHVTNNAGYSGKIMYGTDNAIPFNYKVADESTREKAEILKQKVDKIEPIVSGLELFKKMPMITSPNGTKFRLLVDNNGNLSTVSSVPNRVAVFGNSILSHSWLKGMGMAASDPNKDYFSLVKSYILSKNPRASVVRGNGADWESDPNNRRGTFDSKMKQSLSNDTDIVILQFGDNLNTDEKRKNLETDIPNLINWIRTASPKALIYWVGIYYASPDFVERIKRICKPLDVTFVDIYQYSKDAKYKSEMGKVLRLPDGSNYTITNAGVASHPGDLGHKAIADEIIKHFLF
ncbi:SGNH/GDSL hydrolase family protein [Streptococcus mitis]|uniref:SGNH/GDSL hydrolase family protein n=1 Tax=Streptococcus mitis TaxID=28037 RepID=UPI001BE3D4D1|nr:SGNH/GDSL hydrolase family protein [Streptococcus mitis]MBT2174548.1 SGNH/GDSL hydrolase family protein [Streptococcus mitis]MBT2174620.1 SGNH/GDSL hydrolase family protein [Streptococcus mitis]